MLIVKPDSADMAVNAVLIHLHLRIFKQTKQKSGRGLQFRRYFCLGFRLTKPHSSIKLFVQKYFYISLLDHNAN